MAVVEFSKFVDLVFLSERYSCCNRTIWNWVKHKGFPNPRIRTNKAQWAWEDVVAWENSQTAA